MNPTKEEIINHVSVFLTELEKETIYEKIMKMKKGGNMFWTYFELSFYYGDLGWQKYDSCDVKKATLWLNTIIMKK